MTMRAQRSDRPAMDREYGAGGDMPRSASYTHLPTIPDSNSDFSERPGYRRSLSGTSGTFTLESSPDSTPKGTPLRSNSPVSFDGEGTRKPGGLPHITISKFSQGLPRRSDTSYGAAARTVKETFLSKHRAISDSFASLARKTRTTPSRSPSPSSRDDDDSGREDAESTDPSSIGSSSPRKSLSSARGRDNKANGGSVESLHEQKGTALLHKMKKLPNQTKQDRQITTEKANQRMPKSFSTDKLPSLNKSLVQKVTSGSRPSRPPIEDLPSGRGLEASPRKKDELWSVFRGLESDFQKFDTKPSALKVNVVRSSLLPFLRNYVHHPSNLNLRPEDLERRTTILDKWWNGLLELIDGTNRTIAGTDRPSVLEALSGIMMRSEWRRPPSLSPFRSHHSLRNVFRSKSSTSLDSTQSEFWVESVFHNVRNTFVHNLQAQMATIVHLMSLRNAPASLVSWSGKSIAYAFYFCPGVAEILVRLWSIKPDSLRRVLDAFHLKQRPVDSGLADELASQFPSNLREIRHRTFAETVRMLRQRSPLPPGLHRIGWYGPWTARWGGRDSDLLFVFLKHWHILLEEFMLPDVDLTYKAHAPGFVLVHAQVLSVLDSTIHRQSHLGSAVAPAQTFDDVLDSPETSMAAVPIPAPNVTRLMAENRLIMLLRDFLSEGSEEFKSVRHTFAEVFTCLVKAAARRTSMFNHHACSTLCDFMEEALSILARYKRLDPSCEALIDWAFWLDVCKEMGKSQNTSTEARLLSFLYSIWNVIAEDEALKDTVCTGWLLQSTTFNEMFAHWFPMNRAFFMRLLCWRITRCQTASEVNRRVLELAQAQLDRLWSEFADSFEAAEQRKVAISTAPCNPAPGRRLVIIRNDAQVLPGNLFFTFDGVLTPRHGPEPRPQMGTSPTLVADIPNSVPSMVPTLPASATSQTPSSRKKRSSFLPTSKLRRGDDSEVNEDGRPSTARKINDTRSDATSAGQETQPQTKTFTPHSFKFSLESMDRNHGPPQERRLYPPTLPTHSLSLYDAAASLDPDCADDIIPDKSDGNLRRTYLGRALAEWDIVVRECHHFFERRKAEGVPSDALVETPTMGVETFRRP